jgi:hypothetical protein
LLGPSERKNVERLADQVAVGHYDELHHVLATPAWDAGPLLAAAGHDPPPICPSCGARIRPPPEKLPQ